MHPAFWAVNYHQARPSALERKFASVIERRSRAAEVGAIRRSRVVDHA